MLQATIHFFSELDRHLLGAVEQHGGWTYVLMFVVLTCEVGLVFTPFVPGETLLFAAGALAASEALSLPVLLFGFTVAAVLGNISGYGIGRAFRAYVGTEERLPRFYAKALGKANGLYQSNPVKTVVLSRFVPLVRALAPFVAGVAKMPVRPFLTYSFLGGGLWACCCTLAGFAFGHVPVVRDNFTLGLVGVIVLSVLPSAVSFTYRRNAAP